MKKHFLRAKQIADQTFLRAEKTDVLTDDLISGEKRVDAIKQSCQVISKKIGACMQGSGSESSVEKRRKKMPELLLSNCMEECYLALGESSVLGSVLGKCFSVQSQVAEELLNYEVAVEKTVLTPVNSILENDIPAISKLRKNLKQLTLDMDSAKARHQQAYRHAMQTTGSSTVSAISKTESLKEELEDASMKVDQCKDALATEIFALISRESEMANVFIQWYMLQADYHSRVLSVLENSIPLLEKQMKEHINRPVFGCPLEEHLRVTDRQVAWVLEACVCCLLETALNEEGLFRIAGSATKVKKLKNAFDSGILDITDYVRDPHAIAGALKSYLRELPEPLMTYGLYDEWMAAAKITDSDAKLQSLWQVVHRLPEANYNNLRYIMKFVSKLVAHSDVNKMSSQNIAIVMPPNLLRDPTEDLTMPMGMNMSVANLHSSIIETLINNTDWFFPEEVEFYLTTLPLPQTPSENVFFGSREYMESQGIINSGFNGEVDSDSMQHSSYQNSTNSTSPTSQSPRIIHRPGKKPAPPAPGPPKDHPPPKPQQPLPIERSCFQQQTGMSIMTTSATFERSSQSLEDDTLILRPKPIRQTATLPRSSTLGRPEKPERPSIVHRQSHDNLFSLLESKPTDNNNEVLQETNSSLEKPQKPEKPRKSDPPQLSPKPKPVTSTFAYTEHVLNEPVEKPPRLEKPLKHLGTENAAPVLHPNTGSPALGVNNVNLSLSPVSPVSATEHITPPKKSSPSQVPKEQGSRDLPDFALHQNGPLSFPSENSSTKLDKWDFLTNQANQAHDRAPDRPPRTIPPPLQAPLYVETVSCDNPTTKDQPTPTSSLPERPLHSSASPQLSGENASPKDRRSAAIATVADNPIIRSAQFVSSTKMKPPRPQPPPPPPPAKPKMNNSSEDTRL